MKRYYYILTLCLFCCSCDLLEWNLEKIEYSNFEVESEIQIAFAPAYKTEIVEYEDIGYFWAGSAGVTCGMIDYDLDDSLITYEVVREGYQSNLLYQDKDSILTAFNGNGNVLLRQSNVNGSVLNEYLDLYSFVKSKLGLIDQIIFHDIAHFDSLYLLAGVVNQTIGDPRTILVALTKNLEPLWVRTYISNSLATNIETTGEGEIFIAGIREGHNYILKTNMSGNLFQIRDFALLGRDSVSDMRFHKGSLYFTSSFNEYPFKTRVVSFDIDLKERWFVDIPTIDTNHPVLAISRNDNLVVGYASYSLLFITELDRTIGSNIWCNRFVQDKIYFPKGIIQTSDYGYFLVSETSNGECKVIKTDEEGATRLHPFRQSCQ